MVLLLRVILFAVSSLAIASPAAAQCAFNKPAKATSIKMSLVRPFYACPSEQGPPDATTADDIFACSPPALRDNVEDNDPTGSSVYSFDEEKGRCTVKLNARQEEGCAEGMIPECGNIHVTVKCKGILGPDSLPIGAASAVGWTLFLVGQHTIDDPVNGDMTPIEFPLEIVFPEGKNGALKLRQDYASRAVIIGVPNIIPPCFTYELLDLALKDPSGRLFAVAGLANAP